MQGTSSNCPSCGHSFVLQDGARVPLSECTKTLTGLAHPGALSDLQDRVRSLDALISRLSQEKANTLRAINTICDKTRHLPSEILSHIFQFVRPPIDFRQHLPPMSEARQTKCRDFQRDMHHREEDYHFDLAGVSYRWRQIILSTPQLWTTISLELGKGSIQSHISLLNLYSRCTRSIGISIELDFRYYTARLLQDSDQCAGEESLALLEPVLEAVFTRIAPQIRHLTLISPPSEVVLNIRDDFSLCTSLTIHGGQDTPFSLEAPPTVALELPRLQRVSLRRIDFPFILPWSSITILELEYIPGSVSLDALTRCMNLMKFSNRDSPSSPKRSPSNHKLIVHENLESMLCDDDVCFSSCFRFTRLHTLYWVNLNLQNWGSRNLRIQIFPNLPSTLVSLTLGQIQFYLMYDLQDLLMCSPTAGITLI